MGRLEYWLAISEYCKFTITEVEELVEIFGDLENLWNADEHALLEFSVSNGLAKQIIEIRERVSPHAQNSIIELADKESVHILPMISAEYPDWLRSIKRAPMTLFVRGNTSALQKKAIAIVGTRMPTDYARTKVKEIAHDLVKEGYTIISGLAEGIDTEAHHGALEGGGMTVAVLPCGVLQVTPPTNIPLAEKILNSNGIILSEFGLESPPMRFKFVERNRIISGLSLATIIAEGSLKSGTRHTADFARRQERCLLALTPIDDNPQAELPRNLHTKGVEYISCSEDVVNALEKWKLETEYKQMTLE